MPIVDFQSQQWQDHESNGDFWCDPLHDPPNPADFLGPNIMDRQTGIVFSVDGGKMEPLTGVGSRKLSFSRVACDSSVVPTASVTIQLQQPYQYVSFFLSAADPQGPDTDPLVEAIFYRWPDRRIEVARMTSVQPGNHVFTHNELCQDVREVVIRAKTTENNLDDLEFGAYKPPKDRPGWVITINTWLCPFRYVIWMFRSILGRTPVTRAEPQG